MAPPLPSEDLALANIQNPTKNDQTGAAITLPWVERLAVALVHGEPTRLRELDQGEQLAVLWAAVGLVMAPHRPRPRRRAT
jgi:hypothetical protein